MCRPVERGVVGRLISTQILDKYKNYVYKQDTQEVALIKHALTKLIDANDIQMECPEVKLLHTDNMLMFLNLDTRFFISSPILNLAAPSEEAMALLVAHELAHYLLDH